MPKLQGPLPVAVYCHDCVQDKRCPCYSRPGLARQTSTPPLTRAQPRRTIPEARGPQCVIESRKYVSIA